MSCDRIQGLLPAMADAMLGPVDTLDAVEHLRSCPQCTISWKRHLEIQHYFLSSEVRKPDAVWDRQRLAVLEQIAWQNGHAAKEPSHPFSQRRVLLVAGAATAAAALLLAISLAVFRSAGDQGGPGPDVADRESRPAIVSPKPEPVRTAVPEPARPVPPAATPPRTEEVAPAPKIETPAKDPVPQPDPAPVVPPVPETPVAEPEPEPMPIPTPEPGPARPTEVTPPVPKPETPREAAVAVVLPGDPEYGSKLMEEQLSIFTSPGEVEVLRRVFFSAGRRIEEARAAHAQKKGEVASEIVSSYVALMGEGLAEIVIRGRESAAVRKVAEAELQEQFRKLQLLKEAMGREVDPALLACRSVAQLQPYRIAHRKGKFEVLVAMQEIGRVVAAKTFDNRIVASLEMLDRRVAQIRADGAKADRARDVARCAASYDGVLNRSVVHAMARMADAGRDVSASKYRVIRALDAHLRALSDALKRAPEATAAPIQAALNAAQAGRAAAANVKDPQPGRAPTPQPPAEPKDEGDKDAPKEEPRDPSKDPKGPWNP